MSGFDFGYTVSGLALAAIAAASYGTSWIANHRALARVGAPVVPDSDDVAVARAVGVLVPLVPGGRSSGQMAAAIAHHAARPAVELDHDVCDECAAPICNDTPQCSNTMGNGHCPHDRTLCAVCVPVCRGCRVDLVEQGALSFYSRGPGGGAS